MHTGAAIAQCPSSQNIFSPQFEVAFDDRGKKKQWEANAVVNQGREREVWVCSFVKLPNRTQAVQHHLHFCILGLTAKCFDIDSKCFQKASILFQNVLYLWLKLSKDSDGIFQGSSTHNTLREMAMMIWWCKVKNDYQIIFVTTASFSQNVLQLLLWKVRENSLALSMTCYMVNIVWWQGPAIFSPFSEQ